MKPIDQAQHDADLAELEGLKAQYAEHLGNPEGLNMDDAIYVAISQYGIANLTGVPIERVSLSTKLKAMRQMWAAVSG